MEDIAAMRRRGVDVEEPMKGELVTADGHTLRWLSAELGSDNPLPLSFIQHLTPLQERWDHLPRSGPHPNTALHLERAYVAVADVTEAAEEYSRVLGLPVPELERGTVINSWMAVFYLGPTGVAAGPDALRQVADGWELRIGGEGLAARVQLRGAAAGAGVKDHLHVHLVPRWMGDTNFMPVVADVRVIPQSLDSAYRILHRGFQELKED